MATRFLAPFAPRHDRRMLLVLPALAIMLASGCGHRRSAMRPVIVSPAPVAVPAPAVAPCPAGAPCPSGPMSAAPSASEPAAPLDGPVAPAGAPPRSGSDEPGLEPISPNSKVSPPPSAVPGPRLNGNGNGNGNDNGLELTPPSSMLDRGQPRRTASAATRAGSVRDRVRAYVNDPDDLFFPPKADRPWKYVVLHHSAKATGGYDEIDREHRKVLGWEGCGYHFIIGNGTGSPDGQIEVSQRWSNQKHGVHCRDGKNSDVNEYGIGICLVGDLDKAPPTARQVASAKALVAYLGQRYGIPVSRIETHAHLAASPTACPGRHFPTATILGTSTPPRAMASLLDVPGFDQ